MGIVCGGVSIVSCYDCGRPYGDEHGFPDLIIPFEDWKRISPTGDDGGLLCPSCICKRLHDVGIKTVGAFASGPVESVTYREMHTLRTLENVTLALQGRDNAYSGRLLPLEGAT